MSQLEIRDALIAPSLSSALLPSPSVLTGNYRPTTAAAFVEQTIAEVKAQAKALRLYTPLSQPGHSRGGLSEVSALRNTASRHLGSLRFTPPSPYLPASHVFLPSSPTTPPRSTSTPPLRPNPSSINLNQQPSLDSLGSSPNLSPLRNNTNTADIAVFTTPNTATQQQQPLSPPRTVSGSGAISPPRAVPPPHPHTLPLTGHEQLLPPDATIPAPHLTPSTISPHPLFFHHTHPPPSILLHNSLPLTSLPRLILPKFADTTPPTALAVSHQQHTFAALSPSPSPTGKTTPTPTAPTSNMHTLPHPSHTAPSAGRPTPVHPQSPQQPQPPSQLSSSPTTPQLPATTVAGPSDAATTHAVRRSVSVNPPSFAASQHPNHITPGAPSRPFTAAAAAVSASLAIQDLTLPKPTSAGASAWSTLSATGSVPGGGGGGLGGYCGPHAHTAPGAASPLGVNTAHHVSDLGRNGSGGGAEVMQLPVAANRIQPFPSFGRPYRNGRRMERSAGGGGGGGGGGKWIWGGQPDSPKRGFSPGRAFGGKRFVHVATRGMADSGGGRGEGGSGPNGQGAPGQSGMKVTRGMVYSVFQEIDEFDSGRMTYSAFEQAACKIGVRPAQAKRLFERLDPQGRGFITLREWSSPQVQRQMEAFTRLYMLATRDVDGRPKDITEVRSMNMAIQMAMVKLQLRRNGRAVSLDRLVQAFKYLDRNGDGQLNSEELEDALNSLGIFVTKEVVETIMRTFDKDQSGGVDYYEFVKSLYPTIDQSAYHT